MNTQVSSKRRIILFNIKWLGILLYCSICITIFQGCASYVSDEGQKQRLQFYVDSHPEFSAEEQYNILNKKIFVGLPLEAAQIMTTVGLTGGMYKKDEIVTADGRFQVWNNGWFDMYFQNDRLVMWRKM